MTGRLAETVQRVNAAATPAPIITVSGKVIRVDKTKLVLEDLTRFANEYCRTVATRPLYHALRWLEGQIRQGNVPL